jgi:hypothetical protein
MDEHDEQLAGRLSALERSLPGPERPLGTLGRRPGGRHRRWKAGLLLGIALLVLASGTTGAAIQQAVTGHPGVFAPGGVLACSSIRSMSPPAANAALSAVGYQATWQIEDRDQKTSTIASVPPADGYIVDGVLLQGNELLLVVVRGAHAENPGGGCN